jgi:hypothetical protein
VTQARINELEKSARKAEDDEERQGIAHEIEDLQLSLQEVPALPYLTTTDATMESIARMMLATRGRLTVISDEGTPIRMILGRYCKDLPAIENLLVAYAGGTVAVDRVTNDVHLRVPCAQLSFILSPQPGPLLEMTHHLGLREVGLLARFLYSMPPSLVGDRNVTNPPPIPDKVRTTYDQRLTALLEVEALPDKSGGLQRHPLRFSEGAVILMKDWRAKLEPRLKSHGDGYDLIDWLSKLHGQLARIAANLHLAETVGTNAWGRSEISAETVGRALLMGDYLEKHAWAAYYGAPEVGLEVNDARRILNWVWKQKLASFTRSGAHRQLKNARLKHPEDLEPALLLLERHGYVRRLQTVASGPQGGRPAEARFAVNPHAHQR